MFRLSLTFLIAFVLAAPIFSGDAATVSGGGDSGNVPNWIWLGKKALPGQVVFFRKSFKVSGEIKSAKFYGTCDNEMNVFLNGQRVLRSDTWQNPAFANVTNSVYAGDNVLSIRGKNDQSEVAALLVKLVIETKDKKKHVITTDDSWLAAGKTKKGWQSKNFNDSGWTKASIVGKLGDGPWVAVNKVTLAAATVQKEQKATWEKGLRHLKGFKVEQIYSVPAGQGSWVSMAVDPSGRLTVSDQYGKLYQVTPPPMGGDASNTKVEPINVNLGEAQGLLWAFDSLYVVVNRGGKYQSGLYRVQDTNDDGKLDNVTMLRALAGGGEHGPHGVVLSPDKKSLFVCAGNHTNLTQIDSSRVPRLWGEDCLLPRFWDASGHAVGRKAPAGCIYNVSPDGKKWQLWCIGFRNEYDIAFNRDGELFTFDSDMEWDMSTPWYRPTRVYHCASGAEFGWRGGTAKYPAYYPDTVPPVVDVGPGSPTGVAFGYGAKFPAKYQDAFYICDWSYGKLYAVHMKEDGATYKGELEEFITGTPLPLTDIVVNLKDGAMYFAVGGRRVKSALYRVTYSGAESTAPVKTSGKVSEAHALRRMLESYHGKQNPRTIKAVWPSLNHADRSIRWAARVAVEHQDAKTWQDKALAETKTWASLEALIALARAGDKSLQPKIVAALDRLQWANLNEAQRYGLLRAYGLTFKRMGPPSDQARQNIIKSLDPHYPAGHWEMNWELSKLLVYLESPTVAAKTLKLIETGVTQEEEMAYALSLRALKNGWTMEQRKEYFNWFPKALAYKGGNSFHRFLNNIRNAAAGYLTAEERKTLQPILKAGPIAKANPILTKPRKLFKVWKSKEIADLIDKQGLKNRDFSRGRLMFAVGRCFACHRFSGEGGSTGPDLTALSGRFSPHDIAESIVDPSKQVSDQYQAVMIVTKGGQVISGRIVNLAGDSLRVNTDMFNPNKLAGVSRRQISEIIPSKESMMPKGLIDTMNQEEVLDLMAYLLSRGDRNHAMFRKK